jgi:thiol:disulfide interchange protein DsbD
MGPLRNQIRFLAMLLLLAATAASASEFLAVEDAFKLQVGVEEGQVTAHWEIAPGYYLYQERLGIKFADDRFALGPHEFSEGGTLTNDPTFGERVVYYEVAELRAGLPDNASGEIDIQVTYQGCADSGLCYPPQTQTVALQLPDQSSTYTSPNSQQTGQQSTQQNNQGNLQSADGLAGLMQNSSWTWVLLSFFALGIGLTFTPCVLPMVPILSGIIVGQRPTTRRAFVLSLSYVLGMAITYTLAGVVAGHFGAQWNLQAWTQQPWVLVLFGLVFVVLSLSMFGVYELQLPAALRNRLDAVSRRQKGGQIPTVALMGALSALVVSPCVSAPLAGALIYISTTGDAVMGGAALFALALGMGVPLLMIGTFGNQILPRAGHWMDRVKQAFGVMLLAVAAWLVQRLLPANLALVMWAMFSIGIGLHLGALRTNAQGWLLTLQTLGIAALIWGMLLLVGAAQGQGTVTQPLSGFLGAQSVSGTGVTSHNTASFQRIETRAQFEAALATGEPVMLDFYADWCISCITMEKEIFSKPEVQKLRETISFIQLDVTDFNDEHQQILNELKLIGPPAVLFYASNGEELRPARIVGEVDLSEFLLNIENEVLPNL